MMDEICNAAIDLSTSYAQYCNDSDDGIEESDKLYADQSLRR